MKKVLVCIIILSLLLSGCSLITPKIEGTQISLSDSKITVDGNEITSDRSQAVYAAKDIVFYLAGQDFTYGEGTAEDAHEQSEADTHTVVHITKPGTYVLSGELSLGQIAVDLGEDAEENPEAVVTIILNGVDITCTVAPAIIFYNVYECCSSDEETATKDVDTLKAGANVIIADGTENNINGSYVAKIYKSYELNADGTEVIDSKNLHKYDGAFYSKKTLNINGGAKGNGILNITAENEGLDSELHLTINGGIINISSGNDGINTNEDNVSVTTMNGGTLNILCNGGTGEGDGIDSNGWLVINGGTVIAQACATSGDAGIDSDKGIYINGGKVVASGNMFDHIAGGNQTYAVFSFASRQNGNSTYTLKNDSGKMVGEYAPTNAFTYLIVAGDELSPGEYTFWQGDTQLEASAMPNMNGGMPQGERPEMPNGEQPPQGMPPKAPGGQERPGQPNGEPPEMPNGEISNGEHPQNPGSERPEMPEGMTPPDNIGGMMGGNMMPSGEASTTFMIVKSGNQFTNVSPKD
jgi:hypothetical protein